jgi:hypothetical protein
MHPRSAQVKGKIRIPTERQCLNVCCWHENSRCTLSGVDTGSSVTFHSHRSVSAHTIGRVAVRIRTAH